MFKKFSGLFTGEKVSWTQTDLRHLVQTTLQDELKTEGIYCEAVRDGRVTLCVSSPALHQEALLREGDLADLLKKEAGFEMKKLVVGG